MKLRKGRGLGQTAAPVSHPPSMPMPCVYARPSRRTPRKFRTEKRRPGIQSARWLSRPTESTSESPSGKCSYPSSTKERIFTSITPTTSSRSIPTKTNWASSSAHRSASRSTAGRRGSYAFLLFNSARSSSVISRSTMFARTFAHALSGSNVTPERNSASIPQR